MPANDWQRSLVVAAHTVIGVIVVGVMYWAQAVIVPFALAMLLTLVLAPLVTFIERARLRRAAAVFLVVTLVTGSVAGVGWLVGRQFVDLVNGLPAYSDTIKAKIRSVKELATAPRMGKLGKLVDDVTTEIERPADAVVNELHAAATKSAPAAPPKPAAPAPSVLLQPSSTNWLGQVLAAVGTLGEFLTTLALATVLTIFMLIHRERLRDRLIYLVGHGHMTATTKAVDEAVQRISRFLLMQGIVNGTYGAALALGLFVLAIPYALLWGLLAALLRYIPYVGAFIAAVPPIVLSVVVFDGWTQPLLVIGWILAIELVSNNFVEPLLYGHSIGVSEVALLSAAAFWGFLWGPIGLVLSSPLTVCLVVLGKYVPQLEFIDTLLGDDPALEPHETFYQRLLSRDADEARRIALGQLEQAPAKDVFDGLLVPVLGHFKRDLQHERLSNREEEFIMRTLREIVEEVAEHMAPADAASDDGTEPFDPQRRVRAVLCPAEGAADELAVEMLRHLLDPRKWLLQAVGNDVLAGELLESIEAQNLQLVCVATVAPGGLAHMRYLCKRLRSYRADVKIIAGCWGSREGTTSIAEPLRNAGADYCAWTLQDTSRHFDAWLPVLSGRESPSEADRAPQAADVVSHASA